ncbi:MAG: response regulator [Candidatus Scalindua sp.]|nr:response regulator [Candidatus Scalindua sp.]
MKNLSILIVDDEQYICDFLNEFLSEKGYNVTTVSSGNEAINLIKRKRFDLVLCDMVMPETSGIAIIKALDILDERPKVGVITGWSSKIGKYNYEGLNADFILTKPFDLSELSKEIDFLFPAN